MVKTISLLPVVAALTTSDSNSSTPLAAIATKWSRPRKGGNCFSKIRSSSKTHKVSSLLQNPGAGMKPDDITPFVRIKKDGYMKVNCIKDAMFNHGDKFGPNKHEYKYGDISNVSIVHYTAHVPKEDRQKMTPEVCFEFCRTLDTMLFFGISNGRDCYCTPYYKQMASDSSACDAVCEGETTQMCGGKSKSTMWEMHMCNDDAQKLAEFSVRSHQLKTSLDELVPKALDAAAGKNELAQKLQDVFGQAGDPDTGALMQKAKVAAGKLQHLAEIAEEDGNKLGSLISRADVLTGFRFFDFSDRMSKDLGSVREAVTDFMDAAKIDKFLEFETAKKGRDLLDEMEKLFPTAKTNYEGLSELYLLSEPVLSPKLYMHSGNCLLDADTNCITPFTDASGRYQVYDSCRFEILNGEANVEIKRMQTEGGYDPVTINGQSYSGGQGVGTTVKASGDITFSSDSSVTRPGFEICVNPIVEQSEEEGKQYYPIMYFVDKEYINVAQTCTGDIIGSPIYFKNYHGCAGACDASHRQECVGFAYFPTGEGKPNMCFLFSKIDTVQYYTDCAEDAVVTSSVSFLQKKKHNSTQPVQEEPVRAVCSAKLSKFVGTNLKPDETGKNDFKLKKLTKADRCYEQP